MFGITESNDAYIQELELKLQKYKNIFDHALATKTGMYFICGESGKKDSYGLPERIFVCPATGLDGFAVYKLEKEYFSPEY